MDICRACLCTDKTLSQVDTNFISSYNLLTNLDVKPYDSMPKCFCQSCMESVRCFITFRDKCISSESVLLEKYVNIKVDEYEVEVDVKKEPHGNVERNIQYKLVEIDVKDEIIKEECAVNILQENEVFNEKDPNPLELDKVIKEPRGKPRKQLIAQNIDKSHCGIESDDLDEIDTYPLGLDEVVKRPRGRPKSTKSETKRPSRIDTNSYCGLCDESFNNAENLSKHLDSHRTDECCGICSKTFENWPKLLAHRATHSFRKHCHLCHRRFNTIFTLEKHYLLIHFEEKVKEMCCEHCQKTFTCREKFEKHLETHNIECDICSQIFRSRKMLMMHLRTHEPKKRHECDQCEYTALYAAVLANHKIRRHKKFVCKTCDRKFSESAKLKKHICKDKSKLCPICGEHIYNALNRHLKSHTDVKTFKCEKCPAMYKNALSLKAHMDRHNKNPTHVCDYCGRKFYYPTTLTKHRRVHTGEKPYVCKICGKRFTGNHNLRVHMKVHGVVVINKRDIDPIDPVHVPG